MTAAATDSTGRRSAAPPKRCRRCEADTCHSQHEVGTGAWSWHYVGCMGCAVYGHYPGCTCRPRETP